MFIIIIVFKILLLNFSLFIFHLLRRICNPLVICHPSFEICHSAIPRLKRGITDSPFLCHPSFEICHPSFETRDSVAVGAISSFNFCLHLSKQRIPFVQKFREPLNGGAGDSNPARTDKLQHAKLV